MIAETLWTPRLPLGKSLLPALLMLALGPALALSQEEESTENAAAAGHRLESAPSPYLRAHADNAVAWRLWTEETLAEAREKNLPIFLSIGYSSCHWCHVMEKESFLDPKIAALINENFMPIKVDREVRPDLDHLYMQVYQAMSGSSGGWPLNLWLTPDLTPFYGATYLPPKPAHGLPSLPDVLEQVSAVWNDDPQMLAEQNQRMRQILQELHRMDEKAHVLDLDTLTTAANELAAGYDMTYGGLGGAPKFPQPLQLEFLLTQWGRSGDSFYKEMVVETARHMAAGGIYDQISGGFHRYTVDEEWRVPHFEKMLFTNALQGQLYVRLWQVTQAEADERIARETFDALLRDFGTQPGGFITSWDAVSGGQEGGYYTWLPEEVKLAFASRDDGDALQAAFEKDFELTPIEVKEGRRLVERSVIQRKSNIAKPLSPKAQEARQVLARVRAQRPKPARDMKILTSLNGLTIAALAEAGAVLNEPRYTQAAVKAAEFLLSRCRVNDRLVHSWFEGKAGDRVFLDDYAALTHACTVLYECTGDVRWVKFANLLALEMIDLFWDDDQDAFFFTPPEVKDLPIRPLDLQDSATPSGNSLATLALARLGLLLDNDRFRNISRESAQSVLALFARNYELVPVILQTVYFLEAGPPEIAVVGARDNRRMQQMVDLVQKSFVPGKIVALEYLEENPDLSDSESGGIAAPELMDAEEKSAPEQAEHVVVLLRGKTPVDDQPTLYICRDYTCEAPLVELEAVREQLQVLSKPATPQTLESSQ